MNRDEYFNYISEIKELKALLAEIPENSFIERMSLQERLNFAENAIAHITEPEPTRKVRLTFRGEPVSGSHGILADFGSKAAGVFSDLISTVAADLTDNLHGKGPIPYKQKNQLLITGTAIGSFGFEFELPILNPETTDSEINTVESALTLIQTLFQKAANGTDDEIAELIDEIHPRAFKKAAEFLNHVAQHNAWCSLRFKDQSINFKDFDQFQRASKRLQENNIEEKKELYQGKFQGVLPTSRIFEFQLDNGTVIKGKISQNIVDPNSLNDVYLCKHVSVEFDSTRVGTGKPRYVLFSLDKITNINI